jgi:hypothetical protein
VLKSDTELLLGIGQDVATTWASERRTYRAFLKYTPTLRLVNAERQREREREREEKRIIGCFIFIVMTHFIFEGNNRDSVKPSTTVSIYRLLIPANPRLLLRQQ